jgi:allantoate deiminase
LAEQTIHRCRALAAFTETPGSLTRTFLSEPMHDCHHALSRWMTHLGMRVSVDAIGNLRGLYGSGSRPRRLLIGSHLDTVLNAGAFDGVLGVCLALALLEALESQSLPFDVEVLAFSEEEGVRFKKPFLGSLAAVGRFDPALLELKDANGCTLADAIRRFGLDPARLPDAQVDPRAFAYLEFHIEQGPVLDNAGESLGAVSAVAGQSRLELRLTGRANHAGTTPMNARCDALAGAAAWIAAVEQHARSIPDLVATVGHLEVLPNAGNVIPGLVRASLDVRHADDQTRLSAVRDLCLAARQIAAARDLALEIDERLNQRAVPMDPQLVAAFEAAIASAGATPRRMVSGAGHDAMILAEKFSSAMLFLRSPGGISHHPDESVLSEDVAQAIRVGVAMLTALAAT